MSDLGALRVVIRKSLDDVTSAEIVCRDTLQSLNVDINAVRHKTLSKDDEIERAILSSRTEMETLNIRSARIMDELHLERALPATYQTPTDISTDTAINQMQALVEMSRETLRELESEAQKLRIERKKWWKFWK